MYKIRKFVMDILHGKQGLLCDKIYLRHIFFRDNIIILHAFYDYNLLVLLKTGELYKEFSVESYLVEQTVERLSFETFTALRYSTARLQVIHFQIPLNHAGPLERIRNQS